MTDIGDDDLFDLSAEIDEKLFDWMKSHGLPALSITAVVLARLTWLARKYGYTEDFIKLLDAPREILSIEKRHKDTLH